MRAAVIRLWGGTTMLNRGHATAISRPTVLFIGLVRPAALLRILLRSDEFRATVVLEVARGLSRWNPDAVRPASGYNREPVVEQLLVEGSCIRQHNAPPGFQVRSGSNLR